jgi:hypothetical protein
VLVHSQRAQFWSERRVSRFARSSTRVVSAFPRVVLFGANIFFFFFFLKFENWKTFPKERCTSIVPGDDFNTHAHSSSSSSSNMKKKKSKEDHAFLSECTITTFTRDDGGRNAVAEQHREKKKLHSRNGGEAKRQRASSDSSGSTRDDNNGVFDTFLHISEQVAVVAIVSAVFVLVHARAVRAEEVLVWSVLSAIVGMFCTRVDDDEDGKKTKSKDRRITLITAFRRRVRLGLSVAFAVAISSPLFLTMTASVSDDTAVAVSGILAFVHLATHDYRAESTSLGNALEGVSLVSAIFSSSLMASRLETVLDAFACALLAVGAFTMSMPLRRQLRTKTRFSFATAFSAHGIAAWMLEMINRNLMIAYGITIGLFLTFTPLSFAFARRTLKMKIEGPWAEAKPELDLMRSSVRRAGVPIFRHILANAPSRGKGDR